MVRPAPVFRMMFRRKSPSYPLPKPQSILIGLFQTHRPETLPPHRSVLLSKQQSLVSRPPMEKNPEFPLRREELPHPRRMSRLPTSQVSTRQLQPAPPLLIFKSSLKAAHYNPFAPVPRTLKCLIILAAAAFLLPNLGARSQRVISFQILGRVNVHAKKFCSKSFLVKRGASQILFLFIFIIHTFIRYVQELVKMKDTFIDPLLHPYSMANASAASTPNLDYDYYRAESPLESTDDLPPIAARFMSPTPSMNPPPSSPSSRPRDAPNIDSESLETEEEEEAHDHAGRLYDATRRPATSGGTRSDHPRSPYRLAPTRSTGRTSGVSVPFPSRSHQSLPPAPRNVFSASTHSLGRQSVAVERERERKYSHGQGDSPNKGMLRKFRKSQTATDGILGNAIAPQQLPEDLRICLEVVDSGVLDGHKRLSEALKKRYEDQFPLVRSLADVFVSNVSFMSN